jgi:hypothetical protein
MKPNAFVSNERVQARTKSQVFRWDTGVIDVGELDSLKFDSHQLTRESDRQRSLTAFILRVGLCNMSFILSVPLPFTVA